MTKDQNDQPAEVERRRRLAEALRANLKRRKSQSRGRQTEAAPPATREPKRD